MSAIKRFFNQISQPFLLSLGLSPPLFSDPNSLLYAEFPHSETPLSLADWRDILTYLYSPAFPDEQFRKHGQLYKVTEVTRYSTKDPAGHEVIVVKVDLGNREGLQQKMGIGEKTKLLRIEHDGGIKNAGIYNALLASAQLQEPDSGIPKRSLDQAIIAMHGNLSGATENLHAETSGLRIHDACFLSGYTLAASPITEAIYPPIMPASLPSGPHPSISIYSHGVKPVLNEMPFSGLGVYTVQSIFERDLKQLDLVELWKPVGQQKGEGALYLKDFAVLVAEVSEYRDKQMMKWGTRGRPQHDCTHFANLTMRSLDVLFSRADTSLKVNAEFVDAVQEILAEYRHFGFDTDDETMNKETRSLHSLAIKQDTSPGKLKEFNPLSHVDYTKSGTQSDIPKLTVSAKN